MFKLIKLFASLAVILFVLALPGMYYLQTPDFLFGAIVSAGLMAGLMIYSL